MAMEPPPRCRTANLYSSSPTYAEDRSRSSILRSASLSLYGEPPPPDIVREWQRAFLCSEGDALKVELRCRPLTPEHDWASFNFRASMFLWMGDGPRRFQFCSARSTPRLSGPAAGPPIPEIPTRPPASPLLRRSRAPLTSALPRLSDAEPLLVLVPACLRSLPREGAAASIQGFL